MTCAQGSNRLVVLSPRSVARAIRIAARKEKEVVTSAKQT